MIDRYFTPSTSTPLNAQTIITLPHHAHCEQNLTILLDALKADAVDRLTMLLISLSPNNTRYMSLFAAVSKIDVLV